MTLLDESFTLGADGGAPGELDAAPADATDLVALADLAAIAPVDDTVLPSELVLGPMSTSTSAVEPATGTTADDEEGGSLRSAYARCADGNGTLTHLFFSDDEFDIARAKAICSKCSLAPTCLSGALERAEPYGVWGGQLLVEGVVVAVKRGRGRPPKVPRPALVVDEVPVPPHLVA